MPSSSLTWFLEVPSPTLPTVPVEIPARENYTADEITQAVEKLVQGSIRRPYGILGERKTGTAFDDTMDAAAGVFILTPSAPFYVLLLGSRRLSDLATSAITTALDLLDAVESTNRRVRPLESLTSLGNARTALQALESASSARDSTFLDIEDAPAFQRFDRHTDRFLNEAALNIRSGGEIVQTPQQARSKLAGLISDLTESFQEIQRRVALISQGIEDYNSLNLPSLLSQGVIAKAREVLQERIDQLEVLTPTQRLEFLRDTVLDVLAGKAVVKGFGSLTKSGTFVPFEGTGELFTDVDHPGNPAIVTGDFLDPYSIIAGGDELTFTVDGGPEVITVPIQRSFLARFEGVAPEPYVIGPDNDRLRIGLTGFPNVTTNLTNGTRTIEQVVSEFNASVGSQPLVAEPYFNPEKFNGVVNTQNLVGPVLEFVMITGQWSSLGVEVGDKIAILDGVDVGSTFEITIIATNTATATLISGTASVQLGVLVSTGPFDRFLRIRITDAGALSALDNSRTMSAQVLDDQANLTVGIFPGSLVTCRRTRADEVAASINSNPLTSLLNVPRVSAEAVFVEVDQVTGRSEPTNPSLVISTLYRAFGDITTGGTAAVFAVAGAATAGIVVGDVITLRAAPVAGQAERHGIITVVSDTQVSATMTISVLVAVGVDLEFGLSLATPKDRVVRILDPSPLAGDYRTSDLQFNPSHILLDRTLPTFSGVGGQPLAFDMQVSGFRVDFMSTSLLTDSELAVTGSAAALFVNLPAEAVGSTPFVLFDSDPRLLGAGDLLEVYTGQYNNPELVRTILGFERGQQLIEVDEPLSNGLIDLDFSQSVSTPFARLRKIHRNNYDAFKIQLDLWLALPINQTSFFRDLNRFINPLLVNENPTLSATNTASLQVQELVQGIQQLRVILAGYEVDVVPRVDTLVSSFLERGSDRAVDTLLEGRFRDFFGYNTEEVSYIGDVLERLRDVSRLDLPVRRTQRKEVVDQELSLGEFEEPDFEFDQSDTQDVDEVDIPGSFLDVPGSSQ